jgi:hypothetical protein
MMARRLELDADISKTQRRSNERKSARSAAVSEFRRFTRFFSPLFPRKNAIFWRFFGFFGPKTDYLGPKTDYRKSTSKSAARLALSTD